MCFVPRNGASESLLKTDLCSKPEFLFGASRVELPPRLPVGLRRIPFHLALEARQSGDQAHKVSNAYFKRRAEIDWFVLLVSLGGKGNSLCGVLHVEKLTSW